MAEKISKLEYDDVLATAALDAAKARVKTYIANNKEPSLERQEDMVRSNYEDFLKKLKREYPYDKVSRDTLTAIKTFDSDKMQKYLYQYGIFNRTAPSPLEYAKAIKAADIMPLLKGVAKPGADWLSMDREDLKTFGREHGYDVKSKEGYAALLKDIGEQQVNYERAQLAKEAKEQMGWSYWPRKIIAPSAMQEFENAIMTGGDYDESTAAKMGALDAVANTLMWEAPGIPFTKSNIANGVLGAITQAGAEAGRQGGEVALTKNGQEFDIAPVMFAGGAGATRPAIIGTVQGAVSRVPGEGAAQFSRGVAKALKTGDPAARESEKLARSVLDFNKNVNKSKELSELVAKETEQEVKEVVEDPMLLKHVVENSKQHATTKYVEPLAKAEKAISASRLPEKAKFLGVSPEADGTYDAVKILTEYNKPLYAKLRNTDGVASFGHPFDKVPEVAQPSRVLDKETRETFRRMFPAKYVDESQSNAWTKAGLTTGNLLGGFGSRVEPTFKLKADKVGVEKTYKDEPWYKGMSVRSRKIIDEAFKKKAEEEEEE